MNEGFSPDPKTYSALKFFKAATHNPFSSSAYFQTIPRMIRDFLGIKAKHRIEFVITENRVELKPIGTLEANFGRVKPFGKPEKYSRLRTSFEETVAKEKGKKID